jgi:hypothetical protein
MQETLLDSLANAEKNKKPMGSRNVLQRISIFRILKCHINKLIPCWNASY